jgi:hypothetical protein
MIWSKNYPDETDVHGEPLIQKYATESDVVMVTAGIKRIRSYPGTVDVRYAKKALRTGHNHH